MDASEAGWAALARMDAYLLALHRQVEADACARSWCVALGVFALVGLVAWWRRR